MLQYLPGHQNRMERNVVVEKEDLPIEVPAVREAPAALAPAVRTRFVADYGRVTVGDIDTVAEHRGQALQVFRRQQVIVIQESDAVAGRRLHACLCRSRPTPILREIDAMHFEREVVRHLGTPAAVVDENDLYVPIRAQRQTVQRLRQPPRSVVRPDHDRHSTGRRDFDQRRRTAQVRDQLGRTSGREVAGRQLAVALGVATWIRHRERPVPPQSATGAHVVVAFQLALVVGHRIDDSVQLGRHVHEQVGIEGVVHLVAENTQRQIARRRVVVLAGKRFALFRLSLTTVDQSFVQRAKRRLMIGRHLERRGDQQQVRLVFLEQGLDVAGQLVQRGGQGAILQTVAMAQMRHAVYAEGHGGFVCLFPSPPGVLLSRRPLRGAFDAARTVAHESTHDPRAARCQLQDQASAAQHFVVVVGGQHEDAASHR